MFCSRVSALQRIVRAVAVLPFLTLMMIFPIGVLTGALSNLNTAVCGGTPGARGGRQRVWRGLLRA
jgi:hypothetical protein